MIKREFHKEREDGVKLYRTYSDEGFKIKQNETGIIYIDAVDVENSRYTYSETDEPIEEETEETADFDENEKE